MNPLRVHAKNYGPYRDVSWDIPSGLTAVLGQNGAGEGISSNGAGKTKLLELLPIALFGPRLPWSEYVTLGTVEETCTVELEFEHNGDVYRVRRAFNPRGRGKSGLDLECLSFGESDWLSLTHESQAATQRQIEQLLGLSEATFSQSVFAAQGSQHFADPVLTPAQRKAVLAEALGLDLWDKLFALAVADRKEVEAELAAAEREAGSFPSTDDVAAAEKALGVDKVATDALESKIRVAEKTLNDHRELASQYREVAAKRLAAQAEFDRLDEVLQAAGAAEREIDELGPLMMEAKRWAGAVGEIEAQIDGVRLTQQAVKDREALLSQAREAKRKAAGYSLAAADLHVKITAVEDGVLSDCDRCGQPMPDEAREKARDSMRHDLLTLIEEEARLEAESARLVAEADNVQFGPVAGDVEDLTAALAKARESERELARMEARMETLVATRERTVEESFGEAYAAAAKTLEAAAMPLSTLDPVDVGMLEAGLRSQRAQHTLLVSAVGAGEERVRALKAQRAKADDHQSNLIYLRVRQTELKFMERMYGRDGIPALLLESMAVPQIEAEAQRVLTALGTDLRVELRTQRALKTDDRQKETLDVVVVEPHGERSYASFSGGERTRINLALRIGLARLIASRKGTDCPILCLDEPEFLDQEGLRRLPAVLRSLTEFDKVIVISHDEALVDGFDQTVTVVKDGDRSHLA